MNTLRLGNEIYVWLLWVDATIALMLILLLLATAASRHLVLPQRLYLGGALVAFLAWLAFLGAGGEIFRYPAEGSWLVLLILLVPSLPYILLAEVAVLCWLGAHKPWREFLIFGVLLSGLAMHFPKMLNKLLMR